MSYVAVLACLLAVTVFPHVGAQRNPDLWCGACKGLFDEIEYLMSKGYLRNVCSLVCSSSQEND